jgi:hypothetical protein
MITATFYFGTIAVLTIIAMILHYDNLEKIEELKVGLDEAKLRLDKLQVDIDNMLKNLKDMK